MTNSAILIVGLVALLVFGTLALGLTFVLSTNELRKHHARTVNRWQLQGVDYVRGPAIASFLNEKRRFGMRGNGTLALTRNDVRFARPISQAEIIIPVDEVADAFPAEEFNGWRGGGPFFVIKRATGDLTGFKVADAVTWAASLQAMIARAADADEPTPPGA